MNTLALLLVLSQAATARSAPAATATPAVKATAMPAKLAGGFGQ